MNTNIWIFVTFVDIDTQLLVRDGLITGQTVAGKAAFQILTFSTATNSRLFVTLVNIDTIEAIWREHEPLVTRANEAALGVETFLGTSRVIA